MRAIIGLAVVVVVLAAVGWVTFDSSDNRSSINLETDKIEQDVEQMSESAQDLGDAVQREAAETREAVE